MSLILRHLDPTGHFAATKLLPVPIRVPHPLIRYLEVVHLSYNDSAYSAPSNYGPTCVPSGKSCSAFKCISMSFSPFDAVDAGRGRQSDPLYVSQKAWKKSSCSEVKLPLTSSSDSFRPRPALIPTSVLPLPCSRWAFYCVPVG